MFLRKTLFLVHQFEVLYSEFISAVESQWCGSVGETPVAQAQNSCKGGRREETVKLTSVLHTCSGISTVVGLPSSQVKNC